MSFFRSSPVEAVEPEPPAPASLDLTNVPTTHLYLELVDRGFQVLPAGAFEAAVRRLEARAAAGEAIVAAVERERPELRELLFELGDIAGREFPRAVEQIIELHGENTELRDRAQRSEGDAQRLAHAVVGREIAELERDTNSDDEA